MTYLFSIWAVGSIPPAGTIFFNNLVRFISFRHRSGTAALQEQLRGEEALSQFGRALRELGIEWIAAHSPQAKGRIERLFGTLQDRLVKEMRLAGIDSIAAANHFLETRFLPEWEQRFTVQPRNPRNAHRRCD